MRIRNNNNISRARRSIFLFLLTAIIISACDFGGEGDFPDISYDDFSSGSAVSEDTDGRQVSSGRLKVALPFSEECIKYLTFMYVGEKAGLFDRTHVSSNGLEIPLDILENYDVGLVSELVAVPVTGYSSEDIRVMNDSGTLPDIFLLNGYEVFHSVDLQTYDLSGDHLNEYLRLNEVFPELFISDMNNGKVSAVPLYSTLMMLYVDHDLLQERLSDFSLFSSPLTFQTMQIISEKITDPDNGIFGFIGFKQLLAFLPSAVNPFPGNYLYRRGGFDFRNQAFIDTIELISGFAQGGSAVDQLDDKIMNDTFGGIDPRDLGKVGFWIDDSSNIDKWGTGRDIRLLPVPVVDRVSIPVKVYPVAVNPQSSVLREASELAVYIALDSDSVLFRTRYGMDEGFIPPLSDPLIWREYVSPQKAGDDLMDIREMMTGSHITDVAAPENTEDIFNKLYDDYFYDIIYNKETLESKINDIERKAAESLTGG